MYLMVLLFMCGILLSGVSAVYSIIGLLSIFPAAPYTITLMASALEASKLVIASWLYRSWNEIPKFLKLYFSSALVILIFLTSMAVFGYLSGAHSASSLVSGESIAALEVVDEKIKTYKENIAQSKLALSQMDMQVNELMGRTTDDTGASKAIRLRKSQSAERKSLASDIAQSQMEISKLQIERAPLATSVRKVEAEVGPIKYIAQLIYGDEVNETILDKAVRVVIIMIVFVFDPLAILLLIAANWQQMHTSTKRSVVTKHHIETIEDTTETTIDPEVVEKIVNEQPQLTEVNGWRYKTEITDKEANDILQSVNGVEFKGHPLLPIDEPEFCPKCNTKLVDASGIGPYCPNKECDVVDGWKDWKNPTELPDNEIKDIIQDVYDANDEIKTSQELIDRANVEVGDVSSIIDAFNIDEEIPKIEDYFKTHKIDIPVSTEKPENVSINISSSIDVKDGVGIITN